MRVLSLASGLEAHLPLFPVSSQVFFFFFGSGISTLDFTGTAERDVLLRVSSLRGQVVPCSYPGCPHELCLSGGVVRSGGASEIGMSAGWSYRAFSNKAQDIKLSLPESQLKVLFCALAAVSRLGLECNQRLCAVTVYPASSHCPASWVGVLPL